MSLFKVPFRGAIAGVFFSVWRLAGGVWPDPGSIKATKARK
jgi:hypothetical protein